MPSKYFDQIQVSPEAAAYVKGYCDALDACEARAKNAQLKERLWRAHMKRQYFYGAAFDASYLDDSRIVAAIELERMAYYRQVHNRKAFDYHHHLAKLAMTQAACLIRKH